jgi:hypothetical protein
MANSETFVDVNAALPAAEQNNEKNKLLLLVVHSDVSLFSTFSIFGLFRWWQVRLLELTRRRQNSRPSPTLLRALLLRLDSRAPILALA